jgi:uncharacterized membrane protein
MSDTEENKSNIFVLLLLGNGLGHPLHAVLVHFPIALWLGALGFDILNRCRVWVDGGTTSKGAYCLIAGGLLSLVAVLPTGLAEWSQIKRGRPAWNLAFCHMVMNVITAGLFAASLLLRALPGARVPDHVDMTPFVLCIAGTLSLVISAYLGGRLVYEHGVGVARQSKRKWRRLAEAGGANLPHPAKNSGVTPPGGEAGQ